MLETNTDNSKQNKDDDSIISDEDDEILTIKQEEINQLTNLSLYVTSENDLFCPDKAYRLTVVGNKSISIAYQEADSFLSVKPIYNYVPYEYYLDFLIQTAGTDITTLKWDRIYSIPQKILRSRGFRDLSQLLDELAFANSDVRTRSFACLSEYMCTYNIMTPLFLAFIAYNDLSLCVRTTFKSQFDKNPVQKPNVLYDSYNLAYPHVKEIKKMVCPSCGKKTFNVAINKKHHCYCNICNIYHCDTHYYHNYLYHKNVIPYKEWWFRKYFTTVPASFLDDTRVPFNCENFDKALSPLYIEEIDFGDNYTEVYTEDWINNLFYRYFDPDLTKKYPDDEFISLSRYEMMGLIYYIIKKSSSLGYDNNTRSEESLVVEYPVERVIEIIFYFITIKPDLLVYDDFNDIGNTVRGEKSTHCEDNAAFRLIYDDKALPPIERQPIFNLKGKYISYLYLNLFYYSNKYRTIPFYEERKMLLNPNSDSYQIITGIQPSKQTSTERNRNNSNTNITSGNIAKSVFNNQTKKFINHFDSVFIKYVCNLKDRTCVELLPIITKIVDFSKPKIYDLIRYWSNSQDSVLLAVYNDLTNEVGEVRAAQSAENSSTMHKEDNNDVETPTVNHNNLQLVRCILCKKMVDERLIGSTHLISIMATGEDNKKCCGNPYKQSQHYLTEIKSQKTLYGCYCGQKVPINLIKEHFKESPEHIITICSCDCAIENCNIAFHIATDFRHTSFCDFLKKWYECTSGNFKDILVRSTFSVGYTKHYAVKKKLVIEQNFLHTKKDIHLYKKYKGELMKLNLNQFCDITINCNEKENYYDCSKIFNFAKAIDYIIKSISSTTVSDGEASNIYLPINKARIYSIYNKYNELRKIYYMFICLFFVLIIYNIFCKICN